MSFRKTVCLLGLAASLSVSAGMYQCKKGDVSLPCKFDGWDFGGDALYLSSGSTNLATWISNTNPIMFNYDANWGFRIEASRHFGTGNDFNINWAYIETGNQNFTDTSGTLYPSGVVGQRFSQNGYLSMVNLELGQRVDFGEKWDMRFHAGMEITNLSDTMEATAGGAPARDVASAQLIGARAGIDVAYHVWDAFSFYTDGALGILYESTHLAGPANGSLATMAGNPQVTDMTMTGTATSVDFSIGLEYAYAVQQGDLTTRVGWTAYQFNTVGTLPATWQGLEFGAKWVG